MHLGRALIDEAGNDRCVVPGHFDCFRGRAFDRNRNPVLSFRHLDGHVLVVLAKLDESRIPVSHTRSSGETLLHGGDMVFQELRYLRILGGGGGSVPVFGRFDGSHDRVVGFEELVNHTSIGFREPSVTTVPLPLRLADGGRVDGKQCQRQKQDAREERGNSV